MGKITPQTNKTPEVGQKVSLATPCATARVTYLGRIGRKQDHLFHYKTRDGSQLVKVSDGQLTQRLPEEDIWVTARYSFVDNLPPSDVTRLLREAGVEM